MVRSRKHQWYTPFYFAQKRRLKQQADFSESARQRVRALEEKPTVSLCRHCFIFWAFGKRALVTQDTHKVSSCALKISGAIFWTAECFHYANFARTPCLRNLLRNTASSDALILASTKGEPYVGESKSAFSGESKSCCFSSLAGLVFAAIAWSSQCVWQPGNGRQSSGTCKIVWGYS